MGWTSFYAAPGKSRADLIRAELGETEVIDIAAVPGGVVAVVKLPGDKIPGIYEMDADGTARVLLAILTKGKGGGFSYKDMAEWVGPYAPKAPAALIAKASKLIPDAAGGEYAAQYRARSLL